LIGYQKTAFFNRPTYGGFAQSKFPADLCRRQTQIPNSPKSRDSAGFDTVLLLAAGYHLAFFNIEYPSRPPD